MGVARDSIHVLHVDDEPDFADVTAEYLEREMDRLTVETAGDAESGIERLHGGDFDCVVADYDLPDRDGIEFLETVREEFPDLPYILFTGEGSEVVASEAISAGVSDYIRKQTGTEQYTLLANRIEKAVSRRRAEHSYREIFEKATDGIVVHDPDTGEVLDANEKFCEMNGYDRSEMIGMQISDFSIDEPPYTQEEAVRRIQEALEGEPQVFEWVNVTASGDRLPVEVHFKCTELGGETCVLALVRDRSERENRERELERQNERLEEFASVVSHDLRSPLDVAKSRLELAARECESEHIDAAATAIDRGLLLIDDLLTLARQGEEVQRIDAVSIPAVADDCWELVATAEATLVIDAERTIRADRSQLKQLFENLVRNAVEHGGESVTITIGDLPDGFYVADDGPGISPEDRHRVFEPGYSSVDHGTGFGLNIVAEVVEAHGWTITVADSESGGARFEISGVEVPDDGDRDADG